MSWRENLRRGSFRGVPFEMRRAAERGGQRGAHHVYPRRDQGWVEQLGLADDRIRLDAILIGDDYLDRLDDLRAALKTKGEGELIHPWRGSMTVTVDPSAGWDIEESTDRYRMARISMTFLIAPATGRFPNAETDPAGAIALAAAEANASAIDLFGLEIDLSGAAAVLDDVEAAFDDAFEVFDGARSTVRGVLSLQSRAVGIVFGAVARGQGIVREFLSIGDAFGAVRALFDAAGSIFGGRSASASAGIASAPGARPPAASPFVAPANDGAVASSAGAAALTPSVAAEVATGLKLTLSQMNDLTMATSGLPATGAGVGQPWNEANAAVAAWISAADPAITAVRIAARQSAADGTSAATGNAFAGISDAAAPAVFVPAATRKIANRALFAAAIETALITELARATVAAAFDGHQAAITAMKDLDQRIETAIRRVADSAPDDQISPLQDRHVAALTTLRRVARTAILAAAADLTPIVTRDLGDSLPTLAAIWRLTGDIAAENDLIDRNAVAHPLWARPVLDHRGASQ